MSVLFTISNHHPFNLPKDADPKIARMPVSKMQRTVRYTDQALGAYFKEVRKQAWSKNTIFIITGDHCFHEQSDPGRTFVENFQVPLFLIGPEIEPGMDDRIGQHISVMPTLISHMRLRTNAIEWSGMVPTMLFRLPMWRMPNSMAWQRAAARISPIDGRW